MLKTECICKHWLLSPLAEGLHPYSKPYFAGSEVKSLLLKTKKKCDHIRRRQQPMLPCSATLPYFNISTSVLLVWSSLHTKARNQPHSPRRCHFSFARSREQEGGSSWVNSISASPPSRVMCFLWDSLSPCQLLPASNVISHWLRWAKSPMTGPSLQSHRCLCFHRLPAPSLQRKKKKKIPPKTHCIVQTTRMHMRFSPSAEFTACWSPTQSRSTDKLQSPPGVFLIMTEAPHMHNIPFLRCISSHLAELILLKWTTLLPMLLY